MIEYAADDVIDGAQLAKPCTHCLLRSALYCAA